MQVLLPPATLLKSLSQTRAHLTKGTCRVRYCTGRSRFPGRRSGRGGEQGRVLLLRRALLTPAALLLLLPLGLPASAGSEPAEVELRQQGAGSRWTVATLLSDGSRATSRLDVRGASSPLVLSSRVYVDGTPVSTSNITVRAAGGGRGVTVETPAVAGVEVVVDESEDDSDYRFDDVSLTLVLNPDGPVRRGRVSVVLYAAATTVEGWSWSLDVPAHTEVLGSTSGPEAFAYTARDFADSDLSVYAGHTVPDVGSVYLRANRDARKSLSLGPRFLGSYTTFGTDRLRVTGPFVDRECAPSCDFEPSRPSTRVPVQGEYTFSLDGSSVGAAGGLLQQADTDVALHGATVRPPHGGRL